MKILITDSIAAEGVGILRQHADVDIRQGLKPEQLSSIIGDYDALIVRSQTKVTSNIIEAAGKLQVIGRAGVGVDNIDVEAATRRGIIVINSLEGNIVSTAEHTIAMLLALARRIPQANSLLHAGVWSREFKGFQIRNKVLGIIGLGRVGTEVAEIAKGLRMEVIAYDPMISEGRAERLGVRLVELETLLKTADFITVHVPLNSSTVGLIGPSQLKLVKPTAMLVNCARGGIIDEKALYDALNEGRLAGAAVDVFSQEPAQDNILLKSDKVITTPHLAASTIEAEASASIDIAEQVVAVLAGHPASSPVNAPIISAEAMSVLGPYVQVGTTVGRVAVQLLEGHPESLTIRYQGDIAKEDTNPIKVAVLAGLLETLTEERVNMVNADIIASSRGLSVTEQKESTCENYANMVTVEVNTKSGSTLVAGSSLRGKTHLTRVDDYWLEIEPLGSYMLFTEHKDRPGMIGAVGTIIGNADINISQMQVSRGVHRGGGAMMVICLDESLSEEYYKQILAIPDMYKVLTVKLAR
ncbi:MAG TPA: phosphoglycerate dehydrogenase [Dehalococcoidales bacterium]|nr:phosphoglycerate dehydrogenase [Dehalococcoidales bacterium]